MKIFLNFSYIHNTHPRQKIARNILNIFDGIYSPDFWVPKFGFRFKYLMVPTCYGLSNSDEVPNAPNLTDRNSGRGTIVISIVTNVRRIPKRQIPHLRFQ